jgi:RHS repeat-associated protein
MACQTSSSWTSGTCPADGDAALLQSYTYDYKNRQSAYAKYDGSGGLTDYADYVLDALDRTVSETEYHSGDVTTTNTVYQGDSTAVAKETLSGVQSGPKTYAYDAQDNAITLSDGSTRYSYLYDPRSSVSMLLDSSGNVKESYGYTAYGSKNAAVTKSASGFSSGKVPTNPVRFQGKRFDSGSGSYDMGARRYSPSVGRWLQQDMYYGALDNLGLSQDPLTANRYAFLGANPVNYVEFDGHMPRWDGDAPPNVNWSQMSSWERAMYAKQTGVVELCADGNRAQRRSCARHIAGIDNIDAPAPKSDKTSLSDVSNFLNLLSTVAYATCAADEGVGCAVGYALSAASSVVSTVAAWQKCGADGRGSSSCHHAAASAVISTASTLLPGTASVNKAAKARLSALANVGSFEASVTLNASHGKKKKKARN